MESLLSIVGLLGVIGMAIYVPYLGLRFMRNAARLHHWVAQRTELGRLGLRPSWRLRHVLSAVFVGRRWLVADVAGMPVQVQFQPHTDQVWIDVGPSAAGDAPELPPMDPASLAQVLPLEVVRSGGRDIVLPFGRRQAIQVARRTGQAVLLRHLLASPEGPLTARLAGLVSRDVPPPLKLLVIEVLVQAGPEGWQGLLATVSEDPDPQVCMAAAQGLGTDGEPTLLALVSHPDLETAEWQRCVTTVVQGPEALKRTRQLLLLEDGVRRAWVLQQAPIDEDPAFVGLLLEHLSDPHPGARQAAARGLQQVGGVDQVAPLLAAKEAHKLDRSFARAVDHAVTAIQHVLSGREAGGLALSKEAEGGELSVTEAQGGQLAVSREPDKS